MLEMIKLCEKAIAISRGNIDPALMYDLIFSPDISQKIFDRFNLSELYSYYDPDTSYEEDVAEFIRAVKQLHADLVVVQHVIDSVIESET